MAQMGFSDLSNRYERLDVKQDPLIEIDTGVPWEELRPVLERVWRKPDADCNSRAGRKPMHAVLMFSTLALSGLYNLSDDQMEYQVRDRLVFMRFLGLDANNHNSSKAVTRSDITSIITPITQRLRVLNYLRRFQIPNAATVRRLQTHLPRQYVGSVDLGLITV